MIGIKKIFFCTLCLKHGIFGWGSGREMSHEMILQQYFHVAGAWRSDAAHPEHEAWVSGKLVIPLEKPPLL